MTFAVSGNEFARCDNDDVSGAKFRADYDLCSAITPQAMRLCSGPRLAQRVCLRFASTLGHGFGKVGKENCEPEPQRDLQSKAELSRVVRRFQAS